MQKGGQVRSARLKCEKGKCIWMSKRMTGPFHTSSPSSNHHLGFLCLQPLASLPLCHVCYSVKTFQDDLEHSSLCRPLHSETLETLDTL